MGVACAGYDFVKLTTEISLPVYDAIVDEGSGRGIRIIGHVDPRVGVRRALEAGRQIEHLDGYLETVVADSTPMRTSVSNYGIFKPSNWESLDHVDDAKVREHHLQHRLRQRARPTRRCGAVPTGS